MQHGSGLKGEVERESPRGGSMRDGDSASERLKKGSGEREGKEVGTGSDLEGLDRVSPIRLCVLKGPRAR